MASNTKEYYGVSYETVAASQSTQALGGTGKVGDLFESIIISVATAATGTVSIKDGADSAIVLTAANTPIGVYRVELGIKSRTGAWQVTTGAGATAIAIGRFS